MYIIFTVQVKCEFPYIDRTRKSKKKKKNITLSSYAALSAVQMHFITSEWHLALYIFSHNKIISPTWKKYITPGACDIHVFPNCTVLCETIIVKKMCDDKCIVYFLSIERKPWTMNVYHRCTPKRNYMKELFFSRQTLFLLKCIEVNRVYSKTIDENCMGILQDKLHVA